LKIAPHSEFQFGPEIMKFQGPSGSLWRALTLSLATGR